MHPTVSWIVFTLMYIVIPNTRVKITSGIVARRIAGTAFQFFEMLYIEGQGYLPAITWFTVVLLLFHCYCYGCKFHV